MRIAISDRGIESIIREIESVSREIKTLTKEIESISREIELVRETWSSNRIPVQSFIIPQLSLRELGTRLCREIISDFTIILSVIWQSLKKQPLITIAVGSGLILLGLLLGIIFTSLSNLIILILVFIYIFKKNIFLNKKYQKSEQIKFVNREKLRLQNIEIDLQSNKQELEIERQKLETRQLELEAKRQELEARHLELEVERQEHEARHLELETRIKTAEQELVELEQIREKILETRQNQFDNLKDYERELKEVRLRTLEEKIKEWLAQDKLTLHERASKFLLIQIGRESGELNTIQTSEPIQRFFGVNSRNIARRQAIIETDRGNNLSQAKDLDLLIKNQDFRKGIGLDGKERHGVYEFIQHFLGW